MLLRTFWVGLGGFFGATARYLISGWVQRSTGAHFPYGTMVVNVGGSVLLGFLAVGMVDRIGSPLEVRLLILTGILGSFTTFSTFSYETILLLQDGSYGAFVGNVMGNLILCLTGAFMGMIAARGVF